MKEGFDVKKWTLPRGVGRRLRMAQGRMFRVCLYPAG